MHICASGRTAGVRSCSIVRDVPLAVILCSTSWPIFSDGLRTWCDWDLVQAFATVANRSFR